MLFRSDALLKETVNRFQKVTNILTNIDNNETFLNKKYKELSKSRIDESQKNPDRVSRIMKANLIIQDYISDIMSIFTSTTFTLSVFKTILLVVMLTYLILIVLEYVIGLKIVNKGVNID